MLTYATNYRIGVTNTNWKSNVVTRVSEPTVYIPTTKPTSQPANPAFARALRVKPMRIGLRYIGD